MSMRFLIAITTFCLFAFSSQNIKEYIQANVHQIKSINPSNTNFKDLYPLKKAIGDARVVMLCEQEHADAPCFLAKTRIIKFLHEELDFDVLAFESDFFGLNKGLGTRDEVNTKDMLDNIYWIWSSCIQTSELFNYINDQVGQRDPLIITGFDCRHALAYSKDHFVSKFDSLLKSSNIPFYSSSYPRFKTILIDVIDKEYKSKFSQKEQEFFKKCLDTIQYQLMQVTNEDNIFWHQEIKSLKAHAENAWAGLGGKNNIRDRQMADNLLWLVQQKYPNKKIIVWAHNFHIAKNINQRQHTVKPPFVVMGMEVYKELKEDVYIIGFNSYSGKSAKGMSNPKTYMVDKPRKECFENWIKAKGYEYAFIDLSEYQNKSNTSDNYFKMKGLTHYSEVGNWTNIF